jgi:hypothetical protein
MQDEIQNISIVLELYPFLLGYAAISVTLFVVLVGLEIREHFGSRHSYNALSGAAKQWRNTSAGSSDYARALAELMNASLPIKLLSEKRVDFLLNKVLSDLSGAKKAQPEIFDPLNLFAGIPDRDT